MRLIIFWKREFFSLCLFTDVKILVNGRDNFLWYKNTCFCSIFWCIICFKYWLPLNIISYLINVIKCIWRWTVFDINAFLFEVVKYLFSHCLTKSNGSWPKMQATFEDAGFLAGDDTERIFGSGNQLHFYVVSSSNRCHHIQVTSRLLDDGYIISRCATYLIYEPFDFNFTWTVS